MFNLISIYKGTNGNIVREIIDTSFRCIKAYREDVFDFVGIFSTVIMDGLTIDFKF